jgi:hypothetical protein
MDREKNLPTQSRVSSNDQEGKVHQTIKVDNVQGYGDVDSVERLALARAIAAMSPEEYKVAERKLLRKIDRKLIPWMT